MKNVSLIIAFIVSASSCFSQTLFFNNLNNSTWLATEKSTKEIALRKLGASEDSLKRNATCWHFKDGLLTITAYNAQLKTQIVAPHNYQTNVDKGILTIVFPDAVQAYTVGINSAGNFAILMKKKQKGRNK